MPCWKLEIQTATNGVPASSLEPLESLRLAIDHLQAECTKQREEIERLRAERGELRRMLLDQNKHLLVDPKEWEQLDEKEFSLTINDLLAVVRAK